VALGQDVLAQELVPGPETRIESYHVYVDRSGTIAGEFTGRKIRTLPATCGHSTALEISDAADVRAEGRALAEKLDLRGVAKFDFKRGPDGRLHLLEINPRFNLWHHLGAAAGVNLPAMVYADLTGLPRPRAENGARRRPLVLHLEGPAGRAGSGGPAVALAAVDARLRSQSAVGLGRPDAAPAQRALSLPREKHRNPGAPVPAPQAGRMKAR